MPTNPSSIHINYFYYISIGDICNICDIYEVREKNSSENIVQDVCTLSVHAHHITKNHAPNQSIPKRLDP
ncbi:hypothetical protein EYC80_006178 [Monilinia laxa]|uniref:Uncharacterized protein n=1 Tax=Monilinia laxa TaxID=61186 RepID=A0A5N6KGY1_MONLA|nr:hypothetical protein EYC80_006178 [Monilinia laxa]